LNEDANFGKTKAKLQKKNCSFSSFATQVTAEFVQGGRVSWKLGQAALNWPKQASAKSAVVPELANQAKLPLVNQV